MTSPELASTTSSTPFAATAKGHADPAFPQFHPRPAQGWINDPNGLSYINGRYHVFFQYNPESARHNHICWGHVSSPDLVHWDEHPVALRPQPGGHDEYGCWSGVVTDDDGTPTAVYSAVRSGGGHSQVSVARGSADLVSWNQDGHIAASMPDDGTVTAVRDPFIFRFKGRRYAIQGAGLATGHAAVLLYTVDDIEDWKYQGIWLTSEHPVAAEFAMAQIWECPQLVRVPSDAAEDTWVMMFSLWMEGDEHEHASGVGHLIGSLREDPSTGLPAFVPRAGGRTDRGRDFYAPQVLALPDRALLWGWSNEGFGREGRRGRSQEEIDAAGWAGVLTFPRELSVSDDNLVVAPAREIEAYRGTRIANARGGTLVLPSAAEAVVTPGTSIAAGTGEVRLVLVKRGVDAASGAAPISADASAALAGVGADASAALAGVGADASAELGRQVVFTELLSEGTSLRIFVDASVVEVYRSNGVASTVRQYPLPNEEWHLELPEPAQAEVWALEQPAD